MAEGRMLRRKIALDKRLAQLSSDRARLFFTWSIAFLDREGRMSGDPDIIKVQVFPFVKTFSVKSIEHDIAECHQLGLVRAYTVDDVPCLYFPGFHKNQKIRRDRESASELPEPPESEGNQDAGPFGGSTPGVLPELSRSTPAEVKLSEEKGSKARREASAVEAKSAAVPFERFWSLYPRKEAKAKAMEIWKRLKPDEALFARMVDAIQKQAASDQWRAQNGKYIPHPTTWLNQERWEDETVVAGAGGSTEPATRHVWNCRQCNGIHETTTPPGPCPMADTTSQQIPGMSAANG